MALPRGQVDRFGNPIPANQSVKVFINADGTVPQQRETVKLDAAIVATDDATTQATQLTLTGSAASAISSLTTDVVAAGPGAAVATIQPGVVTNAKLATMAANTIKGNATVSTAAPTDIANSGTAAGRIVAPIQIDQQTLSSANSYTSPSWAGNLYRELEILLIVSSGTADVTTTLTGLTGAYASNLITSDGSSVPTANVASWLSSPYARGSLRVSIFCLNGFPRSYHASVSRANGTFQSTITGTNADTIHDVTAVSMAFTAPVSGIIYVKGILA